MELLNNIYEQGPGAKTLAALPRVNVMVKTAGIVIIGNEILSGMVQECNAVFMAGELRSRGIKLCRISIITDEVNEIARTVREFSQEFTYVFTSGGIGPTHDDVSIAGISKAFNVEPVVDDDLKGLLNERFGGDLTPERLKMAQVPEGAELITDKTLRFPLIKFKNVYIFPGVPKLLRDKFFVSARHFESNTIFSKKIHVKGSESEIAPFLNEIVYHFKEVNVGSYPAKENGRSRVTITLESYLEREVDSALRQLIICLPEKNMIRVE